VLLIEESDVKLIAMFVSAEVCVEEVADEFEL